MERNQPHPNTDSTQYEKIKGAGLKRLSFVRPWAKSLDCGLRRIVTHRTCIKEECTAKHAGSWTANWKNVAPHPF